LETGRLLIEAKDKLEYGDFGAMADNLPFGRRTAERLIAIASNSILADATHGSQLPPSWRTLYELSTLPDATLLARLEDGSIRPDLERSSIKAWKQPAKQDENSPSEQPDQPESDEEPEEEEPGIAVRRSVQHVTLVDPSTTFRRVTRRVRVQAETQHKPNGGLGDGQPIVEVASPEPKPEHEPEAEDGQEPEDKDDPVSEVEPENEPDEPEGEPETLSKINAQSEIKKAEIELSSARLQSIIFDRACMMVAEMTPKTRAKFRRHMEKSYGYEVENELASANGVTELFNRLPSAEQRTFLSGINAVILQGLEHVRGLYLSELHSRGKPERIAEFRALLEAFGLTLRDIRPPRKETES
jgi:hypothetical protein